MRMGKNYKRLFIAFPLLFLGCVMYIEFSGWISLIGFILCVIGEVIICNIADKLDMLIMENKLSKMENENVETKEN